MSQSSFKPLSFITSKEAAEQNLKYVDDRRKGLISSFKTKFLRFNKVIMNGLEDNTIICISALSGAGKSTLSKCFRDSISDLNPTRKFKQFIMNFEMVSHSQISRSVVAKSRMKLHKLYSVDDPLTDEEFNNLTKYYRELAKKEIYFIDVPDTAERIVKSLYYYWLNYCKEGNYTLVYEIVKVS